MAIHINKLYTHTAAVVTHICIYSSEPCTNVHAPQKQIYWYLVYKAIQTAKLYQYKIVYVLTTGTVDHEQVWQPYAVDPYYSAISKWWPYFLAPYINTDNQQ